MKKKAPTGYDEQLRRYYEDLIRMSRPLTLAVACALAAGLAAPAAARRDHLLSGDATKAARLIAEARLDDARPIVADLARRAPDAAEVRWLASQVAFLDGDYPAAVAKLDGVADSEIGGEVEPRGCWPPAPAT